LLSALKFHQAVIESLAVGVVVVDVDARIVSANPVAAEILGKSPSEVLNHPVLDIFPPEATPKLASVLKQVAQLPEKTKMSFLSDVNRRAIRVGISIISQSATNRGWVLVLEDITRN
jgi:PAS domain S-box-containing protein